MKFEEEVLEEWRSEGKEQAGDVRWNNGGLELCDW